MNGKQLTDILVSLGDATLAATGAALTLAAAGLKKIERGCTKAAVYLFNQTPGTKVTMDDNGRMHAVEKKKTTTDEDEFDRARSDAGMIDNELAGLILYKDGDAEGVLRDLKDDIYLGGCVTAQEAMDKIIARDHTPTIFLSLPYAQYGWDDLSEAYVFRDVTNHTLKPQGMEFVWKIHFPPVKKLFDHD